MKPAILLKAMGTVLSILPYREIIVASFVGMLCYRFGKHGRLLNDDKPKESSIDRYKHRCPNEKHFKVCWPSSNNNFPNCFIEGLQLSTNSDKFNAKVAEYSGLVLYYLVEIQNKKLTVNSLIFNNILTQCN